VAVTLDDTAAGVPGSTAARAMVRGRGRGRFTRHLRTRWQLWLMLAPAVVVTAVFAYVPMYGIQLAFREFDFAAGLTGGRWVGFKYFTQFFESPMFWDLIRNTVTISFTTLVVGFVAPVALALMVNQIVGRRRKRFTQTATYLPHFISIVVVVGMLQVFLSPTSGVIPNFLGLFGIEGGNYLGDPDAFVPVYVISEVWQHCGWNSIIYLAALSSIDTALYEAARMDGASRPQIIRHIELPALVPTMAVLFILNMGGVLNAGFEKIFLMQNPLNLPASEVISTYVYKIGILQSQFSYSTAIGLFNTVINFAFLVLTNQLAKKFANTSLW